MTAAARETLEDCRGALDELVDGVQGRDWRRKWILAVVLLRAVGHVLDKVDGAKSFAYRVAVDEWWSAVKASKPAPSIFWNLIEEERNTILKQYQTAAGQGVTVQISGIEVNLRTGELKIDPPKPPIYHYTFNYGPYKDLDQREVLSEAIAWWEQQLDSVDRAANAP